MRDKLRMSSLTGEADRLFPLQRRADGRVVLSASLLRRLGEGRFDTGLAFARRQVRELRAENMREANRR